MHYLILLVAVAFSAAFPFTSYAAAAACPSELSARIPPRSPGAAHGSEFVDYLATLPAGERQDAIVAEMLDGNVPDFLRQLAAVTLSGKTRGKDRRRRVATVCVTPDFLAIGSNEDFVRMPMDLPASTTVAHAFGFVLPTRKIVTEIHRQAAFRFRPEPLTPSPQMSSPGYYRIHNATIRAQRGKSVPLGALVAGHKKTVVLTNRLNEHPDRVAIFGWFRRGGDAIQPLSTVHSADYADYSHGTRLVSEMVMIDGQRFSIYDILQDPQLAGLLSYEGVIRNFDEMMDIGAS